MPAADSPSQDNNQWIIYAVASGGCAALNGALAKLTTTALTSQWSTTLATFLGFDSSSQFDYGFRSIFFLLNLLFNGLMWALFTRSLTLSSSTVRVSVINTSSNFLITALLGLFVFDEKLPGLWWIGAGLLVAGSVIIGSRDDDQKATPNVLTSKKTMEAKANSKQTTFTLDSLQPTQRQRS